MERVKALLARLKDITIRGYNVFQENRMSVYSSYATLFIVTAIFPCIALIISIVNLLPGYSAEDVTAIFFQLVPDLGPVEKFVETMMVNLQRQSGGLLASVAAVTTLWAASKGVSAIQNGLNELDQDPKLIAVEEREPETDKKAALIGKGMSIAKDTLKRLLFTLTLIVLIPALLLIDMLGDSIVNIISSIVKKLNPEVLDDTLSGITSLFHLSSLVVILFALFVIVEIYAALPAKRRKMKTQLPGALLTGVCWVAFTELFSFFIPRFYHASSLYGSLASLFLILLWLRFIVMILFGGAVLNHTLEEEKLNPETGSGSDPSDA